MNLLRARANIAKIVHKIEYIEMANALNLDYTIFGNYVSTYFFKKHYEAIVQSTQLK